MKKIIEIKAGRNIKLSDFELFIPSISMLWTIYNEDEMWNHFQYNPDNGLKVDIGDLNSLKPSHKHGLYFEERIHDWDFDYRENLLHYYSKTVEQGEKIKILIDYELMKCQSCQNWKIGAFDQHFCEITGANKGNIYTCEKAEKNVFDHGNVYDK